jgi:hypothetical protein
MGLFVGVGDYSGAMVASSISMTGISSRIGYTRRQDWHWSPALSEVGLTGALQAGQTRIWSR